MQNSKENNQPNKTRFRKVVKRVVISLSILFCSIIVFIVLTLYSTPVRQFVLSNALNIANNFLLADVSIKDIYFNGLDNITIENILIKTDQDTLADVQKIKIKYDLKSILTNNIQINKIELVRPKIALLRSAKDSIWNYNKIAKPAESNNDDTTKSELYITINQIVIDNGKFKYWDSLANWELNAYFNPIQMVWNIKSFNAKNINVDWNKNLYAIDITNLTTNELNSKIDIKNFSSQLHLSGKGMYANNSNVTLINTLNSKELESNINFSAEMTNFDVFGEEELNIDNALMSLNLNATGFNCNFIDNFQILPIRLGEVKNINIEVIGTLTSMQVPYISVNIDNSNLQLKNIKLTNLTNSDNLSYQGEIENSKVFSSDIQNFLTDLNFSALQQRLNEAFIKQTYFYGTTDSVFTKFDINSDIGDVYGDISLAFGKKSEEYNINVTTNSLNLQKVIDNSNIISNLNSTIQIKGNHFDLNNLNADIDVTLYPSIINRFTLDTSIISCSYQANSLAINNCKIVLNNRNEKNSNILINGLIDIKDYANPKTNLNVSLLNISPAYMLDNNTLPKRLTGDISINSQGASLSNLIANAKINIDEIIFNDKSLFPFTVDAAIALNDNNNNKLQMSISNIFENILDLNVQGQFDLPDVIYYLNRDAELITNFTATKLNDTADNTTNIKKLHKNDELHNNIDLDIKMTAVGLKYLDFLDDNITFDNTNAYVSINYYADSMQSKVTLDSINIYSFNVMMDTNSIQIDSLNLSSYIEIINDMQNTVKLLNVNINSRQSQQYNTIKINDLYSNISYNSNKILFNIDGRLNDLFGLNSNGYILIDSNDLTLSMDTLTFGIGDYFLKNNIPINIDYINQKLNIKQFILTHDNNESIEIVGNIYDNTMDDMIVKVNNLDIDDIRKNIFNNFDIVFPKINGLIDSMSIIINGLFIAPEINANINLTGLNYDNYNIGDFNTKLHYLNKNIYANANINDKRHKDLLSLVVTKFPISLSIDSNFANIDTTKQIDISLKINDLPSQIVAPFIPQVDNLSGLINGDFNINGYLPDKYEYNGQLDLKNLKMRIVPINMQYVASGSINANTDVISFNSLKIKNMQQDISNGEANIDGKIKLNGLKLDSFDITANTKQFQILSDNTQSVMPFFYGKMIIATNGQPIRIFGTLEEPNLSGSVILNADVKMPQILNNQVVKRETKFNYTMKDDIISNISNSYDTAKYKNDNSQKNFIDLLNIDINLQISRFAIALELENIGSIFARVGTKEPNAQLNYKKLRTSQEAKIYGGELEILDGSTLQIYKTMSASGTISFPSARISQPTLNLTAEYKGKTTSNYPVNYSVFVGVKGTPQKPEVDLTYSINGNMVSGDKQQIQFDALNALTRGIIRGYSDDNSSNILGESNLSNLFVSQVASKTLTDLVLKTGVIQSANLKFDDNNFNSANVSVSGLLWNYATWTLGGKIEDIASNYNLSVDFPLNLNYKFLNNILLQFSKTTDVNNAAFDRNTKDWEINLKFNGNW